MRGIGGGRKMEATQNNSVPIIRLAQKHVYMEKAWAWERILGTSIFEIYLLLLSTQQ